MTAPHQTRTSEFYFTGLVLASELDVGENDSVLSMAFNVAVNSHRLS